jgi:hypothetical protein
VFVTFDGEPSLARAQNFLNLAVFNSPVRHWHMQIVGLAVVSDFNSAHNLGVRVILVVIFGYSLTVLNKFNTARCAQRV